MKELIAAIKSELGDSRSGLPEDLFLFISQLTPMINVDLLIRNELGETLLTWREDELYGPGWHVPGGIVRFKEKASDRIRAVADKELGAQVTHGEHPLRVTEMMNPNRDVRGHFISLLYRCSLSSDPSAQLRVKRNTVKNGEWDWFSRCPEKMIHQHRVYSDLIGI